MRIPRPLTGFGAVLVFSALAAAGGKSAGKPVKAPPFVPVWDDAVAEAKALNLPLVIHRHGFYWGPCWSMHRAVLHSAKYIRYARENAVEVITMEEIDVAERKNSKDIRTYKTKDAYGDEVEYLAEFPGITMEDLKRISADTAPPIEYMRGGKIPYHGFVDPHTMKEMESVRGKRSVAQMIALIEKHKKTLKEKHGAGIERKHWREAGKREIEIDLALAKSDFLAALEAHDAMALLVKRPAEALKTRIESAFEVIESDLAEHLDAVEALDGAERKKAVSALKKLLPHLKDTKLEKRATTIAGTQWCWPNAWRRWSETTY